MSQPRWAAVRPVQRWPCTWTSTTNCDTSGRISWCPRSQIYLHVSSEKISLFNLWGSHECDVLLSLFGASAADPLLVDGAAECVYFVGNSLGLQPKLVRTYIEEELEKWAKMYVHCSLICGRC